MTENFLRCKRDHAHDLFTGRSCSKDGRDTAVNEAHRTPGGHPDVYLARVRPLEVLSAR
jgi:hypothetical protein